MIPFDPRAEVEKIASEIRKWRREIHRHPELSFQEKRTSERVRRGLREHGIEVRNSGSGFGLVAEIEGQPGPRVGLRADMDALPIQEETPCDFASEHPGVMHACGHDAHTAMLMGAAVVLKRMADHGALPGTVRLIFQPAEEKTDEKGKSGGRYMVEEGVLDGLSAIFAQHVSPVIEAGKLSFLPGTVTASSDQFEIVVRGRASHGAMPHEGRDAIVAAAAVVQGVQQIVSRRIDPVGMGLITIGTIHGGAATNILAEEVRMTGTIRAFTEETRRILIDELTRVCRIAGALGAEAECLITEGYPVGNNHAGLTALAENAIRKHLGEAAIHPPLPASPGSEDFAFMSGRIPGSFIWLGVKDPCWNEPLPLHTPSFQIDECSLATGAAALVSVATEYLAQSH